MIPSQRYVVPLNIASKKIGGKARGLHYCLRQGLRIPETYICTSKAYELWNQMDNKILGEIRKDLEQIIEDKEYIIRSSAELEDTTEYSFAGQFLSIASVKGIENILAAIVSVWNSRSTDNIKEYSNRMKIAQENRIAVIIQEMLEPEYSGVVFTRNPLNGVEEIVIEAINGSSFKILQKGLDPERWIYRWGKFIEKPEKPSVSKVVLKEIAEKSKKIEEKKGVPVDLEWIYSQNKVWWIQLREITTIDRKNYYSNRLSSEHLPGLIKPLVWSINIPLVCEAWIRLLREMIGDIDLEPNEMAKQFYFRAYYNMSALGKEFEKIGIPRDSLEIIIGGNSYDSIKPRPPIRLLPRLFWFALEKIFYERKLKMHLRESGKKISFFREKKVESTIEALKMAETLFRYNKDAAYYVIVSQLLHSIFYKITTDRIRKRGENLEDFPFDQVLPETNPYYSLTSIFESLDEKNLDSINLSDILNQEVPREKYKEFMDNFGHLRESGNDFSQETWAEKPEIILDMLKQITLQPSKKTPNLKSWLNKKVFTLFELREKISFNYLKTYGYFRKYFLIIGRDFVDRGLIEDESDIFYLTFHEIKEIIQQKEINSLVLKINKIKNEIEFARGIEPPSEVYGETPPSVFNIGTEILELRGIAASNGYYRGIIRHVKSANEFINVHHGDIIVIPYSDIAWLPILSKAGAIVSESGGILSHAAVIAREYELPAVLGAKNAFNLPDNSEAIVDGYNGTIKVIKEKISNSK